MNVMIATLGFEAEPLIIGMQTFNVKKLIIIREADPPSEAKKVENLMHNTFGSIVEIEVKEVETSYDILGLVDLMTYLINSEHDKGNHVFVNVTGGRKTSSISALLGVFKNIDKVSEVFYVTEEAHQVIPLPKISWSLHKTKLDLLKMLNKGVTDIEVLKDELDISRTMTYTHLRDLKEQGLINETSDGFELTLAGKLIII
ncbi:MAG: CRISPR-associated CARF protein Csa3 [Euryarchaeota archaeon]